MAPHLVDGFQRRPATGLRAGAERLRSPLHLLHHPVWPRQFALGADGRGGRAGPRAGRARPRRDRADRRRSDELWRRSAGRAKTRAVDQADPAACARTEALADFLDRFDRGRSRSARCDRRRRAADAASASVAAVRRRSDPEADEAAAFPATTRSILRRGAAAAAGHRARRRYHRGLSDRDGGDVRAFAGLWSRNAV